MLPQTGVNGVLLSQRTFDEILALLGDLPFRHASPVVELLKQGFPDEWIRKTEIKALDEQVPTFES